MARHPATAHRDEPARAPMLVRATALDGFTLGGRDGGDIGRVKDVYFDDESFTVRALVVDTGGWLSGRRVVLPPLAIQRLDLGAGRLETGLTREQVERCPAADETKPVSRQHEVDVYSYYGWPYYWLGPYRWGPAGTPGAIPPPGPRPVQTPSGVREAGDPNLRSAKEVTGYTIGAADGELGHVVDFLIDEESWAIRYMIVDPRSWWPGPHGLISTEWITGISWGERAVQVDLTREQVRRAPEYDTSGPVDRGYETRLHAYYGRPGYWDRPADAWLLRPPAA
jgi:uncharacterized protein YrrD